MSLKDIYAPTMAYWRKWKNILVEREKKQKEHEVKWIKRREEEWENYWKEQSTQFGAWEEQSTQFGAWEREEIEQEAWNATQYESSFLVPSVTNGVRRVTHQRIPGSTRKNSEERS